LLKALGVCFVAGTPVAVAVAVARDCDDATVGGGVALQPKTRIRTRCIEDIRVGERVLAFNPDRDEYDDSLPEPDASWRVIQATAWRPDGRHCTMEILRPQSWIAAHLLRPGVRVPFHNLELGFDGTIEVTGIAPCPRIEPGLGRVVLATFAHENYHELVEVELTNGETFVGTETHPFWSADRQAFVPLGALEVGERLGTHRGATAIADIRPHAGSAWVYNIEVHGEHCYELGDAGVVVHNNCHSRRLGKDMADVKPGGKGWQAGHIVPTRNFSTRSKPVQDAIKLAQGKFDEFLGPAQRDTIINGFWAKAGHAGTHTDEFFLALGEAFKNVSTKEAAEIALKGIWKRIERGEFIK
jgi:hypothetical protein